jgi:hypothetical protein
VQTTRARLVLATRAHIIRGTACVRVIITCQQRCGDMQFGARNS